MIKGSRGNQVMFNTVRIIIMCSVLLLSWGCTQKSAKLQRSVVPPDQDLYEKGSEFLNKGNYIRARLTLQTMINTYPDSEMTADAYFAVADTYFEEGGTTNWLQAEQQYKDFIVFFPANPKAPDAQMKIIALHRKMMSDPDRDQTPARKGEQAALKFLELYPDHDYAPMVRNELDNFRNNLALSEMGVANFYSKKDNVAAVIGRYETILEEYPNFYKTPEVLYKMADAYLEVKNPDKAEEYLDRLVAAYPFSEYADAAKVQLTTMEKPIPTVDTELAELNKSKIKTPQGFTPLRLLGNFAKATGFSGPPDIYDEARAALEAKKKAEEEAAGKTGKKDSGIDIEDVIRK